MGEIKHSKHKNIGIIFELLSRQIVSDILCGNKSAALNIVKKSFSKGSELSKELTLYRSLQEFNKKDKVTAGKFLDLLNEQRKKLDSDKLKKEKYKLLGEIKKSFNESEFFTSRISNYKLLASIYKLFEYSASASPSQYINNYEIIVESLITPPDSAQLPNVLKIWESQPQDIKKLAFQLVLGKFDDKYKGLTEKQKTLISKFINENPDSNEFKDFIIKECSFISKTLSKLNESIVDKTLSIKLNQTIVLLNEIISARYIKDEHLTALLSYYELIETLKGN